MPLLQTLTASCPPQQTQVPHSGPGTPGHPPMACPSTPRTSRPPPFLSPPHSSHTSGPLQPLFPLPKMCSSDMHTPTQPPPWSPLMFLLSKASPAQPVFSRSPLANCLPSITFLGLLFFPGTQHLLTQYR